MSACLQRPPLNPDPAFLRMGVMRSAKQGGGDQPGAVGWGGKILSRYKCIEQVSATLYEAQLSGINLNLFEIVVASQRRI